MHNNYFFLRKLVSEMEQRLLNATLVSCFSQQKDELMLHFGMATGDDFYIRAYLQADFCCLSFPEQFNRSKRNSIDLFPELINRKISALRIINNDRAFLIAFEGEYKLLFKMHGNRSNIVLFKHEQFNSLFKHNLPNDRLLDSKDLDRNIVQSKTAFIQAGNDYRKVFPTFGQPVIQYLHSMGYTDKSPDKQWEILELVHKELLDAARFYLQRDETDKLYLTTFEAPSWSVSAEFSRPIQAINAFFYGYIKEHQLRKEKGGIVKELEKKVRQAESYISKNSQKLVEIRDKTSYSRLADVIMANLHQIPPHSKQVSLFNFYANEQINVDLKQQSPQKVAENLYRKAKNQKKEIEQLEQNIALKEKEWTRLCEKLEQVNLAESYDQLKPYLKKTEATAHQDKQHLPYKKFQIKGFEIWVGKNARSNDELTLKYSYKEDLWIHAKDVSGSHVLLKYQSGRDFPKEVIEGAAQLAAYYSKRKTDSLCPVIVTPKKYVRKAKGLAPGKVIVEREEVVMVEPKGV